MLHDQAIEKLDEKDSQLINLTRELSDRIYRIEAKWDLKSKGSASEISYSPEVTKRIIDGILDREKERDIQMITMKNELTKAVWAGLTSLAVAIAGAFLVNHFVSPAKAEIIELNVLLARKNEAP